MYQYFYSAPIGERSIAISLSVCLSVREHISGTTGPIFTFYAQIPYGRGSVLLWQRCATLCTSGLWMTSRLTVIGHMVMRGRLNHTTTSGVAIPGRSMMSMNALLTIVHVNNTGLSE